MHRLPPTTTYKDDNGNRYVAYGQPPLASAAAVQFVIIPGFQLSFTPTPQDSRNQTDLTPEQLERFKTCLKAYNVEYKGHVFRLPGKNNSDDNSYFYGHTERGAHWYSVSAIGDFTIRTDEHSYSVSD